MISAKLLIELQQYIDSNISSVLYNACEAPKPKLQSRDATKHKISNELTDFIDEHKSPAFNQLLFNLIDAKNLADAAVYKKAYIDRRLFSKIRTNADYHPKKNTVIALALALELNKDDTTKLLTAAGYSLNNANTLDLIIQYAIEKNIYDIIDINLMLDHFSIKPLISC